MQVQRKGIGLMASIAIALVAALLVGVLAVALFPGEFTTTVTKTSYPSTSTTTTSISSCTGPNPETSLTPMHAYSTNCELGITLGVETNPVHPGGMNGSVSASISTDFAVATNLTYTGFPSLPHGLDPASPTAGDYLSSPDASCDASPPAGNKTAFFVIYNSSGSPLQLNDNAPNLTACGISGPQHDYYSFDYGLEILNATTVVGGYWTSADAAEPWVNATYQQFPAGSYTIVAFDAWNQTAELNFTVTSPTTSEQATAGEVTVTIPYGARSNTTLNFEPADIRVVIGINNTVLFANNDTSMAQVVSTSWPNDSSGFQTGMLSLGQSSEVTLTVPGTYDYEDRFDPVWLTGTIVVEPLPLQLEVTLNATTIQSGGGVLARISIVNPLGVNVTVPQNYENDSSILSWNAHDFLCGGFAASNPTWSLAGYALFQGHHTSANLSSAGTQLTLAAPLVIECVSELEPSVIVFYPNGSNTVAYFPPNNLIETTAAGVSAMNATTGCASLRQATTIATVRHFPATGPAQRAATSIRGMPRPPRRTSTTSRRGSTRWSLRTRGAKPTTPTSRSCPRAPLRVFNHVTAQLVVNITGGGAMNPYARQKHFFLLSCSRIARSSRLFFRTQPPFGLS